MFGWKALPSCPTSVCEGAPEHRPCCSACPSTRMAGRWRTIRHGWHASARRLIRLPGWPLRSAIGRCVTSAHCCASIICWLDRDWRKTPRTSPRSTGSKRGLCSKTSKASFKAGCAWCWRPHMASGRIRMALWLFRFQPTIISSRSTEPSGRSHQSGRHSKKPWARCSTRRSPIGFPPILSSSRR